MPPPDKSGTASIARTETAPESTSTGQEEADSQLSHTTGYAGWDYQRRGWQRPIPLPAPDDRHDGKGPPPAGYTGHAGLIPSGADIQTWTEDRVAGNTAIVMQDGIVGIDVDHYGDKRGGDTITAAEKLWGPLPVGPRSTSRPDNPISGIRFFRVPEGATFNTILDGGGVEIIQPHHRYAVVWPSIHHEGRQYVWLDAAGNIAGIPAVEDLPWLPDAWVTSLFCTPAADGADFGMVDVEDTFTDGEPDDRVTRELDTALEKLNVCGSRYDSTLRRSLALMRLGQNGHPGVEDALQQLGDAYVDAVKTDRQGGKVTAVNEYKRMLHSPGARRALAVPSHQEADEDFFAAMTREHDGMTTQTELEDPIPLTGNTIDVPPFPVDALPDVIANMVTELAEATQTDPAMAATSALTALAACIGGHAKIQVRRGWVEPLCLYTNTIARPAERKSAVQGAMVAPLHDAEEDMSTSGEMERMKLADELDMAKRTVDQLNKAAVNAAAKAAAPGAADKDKTAAAQTAQAAKDAKAAMRGIQVPVIPRLLADDVTPEATASLLADHRGRIAIVSAEGGIFDTIAGRYARTVNMDVFLKGHSGDRIRVDRQGRPPQYIPSPALTMGLMVQPRVIEAIAANRDFVGRGLLARFLYAAPASKVGHRVSDAAPVSELTESRYTGRIKKLASDLAGWAGDPAVLLLDELAEAEVRRIQDEVEPTLAGNGELASPAALTEWGGKYVGAVVRIAGLLHLAELGANPDALHTGLNRAVQADTIKAAERIGQYFRAVAINVFSQMGADRDTADAIYLLDRVEYLGQDDVSERELFTASSRPRFPATADMMPALRRLVEHGYLTPLPAPKPTGGRPASPRYKVRATSAEAAEAAQGSTG